MAEKKTNKGYLTGKEIRAITKANAKEMKRLEAYKNRKAEESEFLTEMSPTGGRRTHFLAQRRVAAGHPIEKVGAELRKMMTWLKK